MPTTYDDAPGYVYEMGQELVRRHHDALRDCKVRFVMRHGPWWSAGKEVLGKTMVLGPVPRYLTGEIDAAVILNAERWDDLQSQHRRALLDHQLSHLDVKTDEVGVQRAHPDGRPMICTVNHDVEEFLAIIERHGYWRRELEQVAMVIHQIPLPLDLSAVDHESDEQPDGVEYGEDGEIVDPAAPGEENDESDGVIYDVDDGAPDRPAPEPKPQPAPEPEPQPAAEPAPEPAPADAQHDPDLRAVGGRRRRRRQRAVAAGE